MVLDRILALEPLLEQPEGRKKVLFKFWFKEETSAHLRVPGSTFPVWVPKVSESQFQKSSLFNSVRFWIKGNLKVEP